MRAIIGPNGAGKTTMMDVVTGKTRPDTGDVISTAALRSHPARRDRRSRCSASAASSRSRPYSTATRSRTIWSWRSRPTGAPARPCSGASATPKSAASTQSSTIVRLSPMRDRLAGSLSTARSNGWRSACCWRRSPKLLLVDEPVAGMTDAETRQTAELLKEINRDHTVVVVEHDMTFVRELGVKVTCLHEGSVLAEGTIDQVSPNSASSKCIWGDERCSRSTPSTCTTAPPRRCARVSLKAEPGKVTCVLGRNGVGKTSLLRALVGQHAGQPRAPSLEGSDITGAAAVRTRPARHRLCAAGPRNLSAADGRGESRRPASRR